MTLYRKHNYEFTLEENEISTFNEVFQIENRDRYDLGTDFVLLEAHEFDESKVQESIIQNWSIPIFEGSLKLKSMINLSINIISKNLLRKIMKT